MIHRVVGYGLTHKSGPTFALRTSGIDFSISFRASAFLEARGVGVFIKGDR